MSIFRIKKDKNYTCMSNHHLRNANISLKAIGLLSVILSMPDNYKVTIQGLAYSVKDGVSSVRNGVNELISAGYIVRRQNRSTDGTFCEYEYDVYENPLAAAEDSTTTISMSEFINIVSAAEKTSGTPDYASAEYDFEENFDEDEDYSFDEDYPAESLDEKTEEKIDELNEKVDALSDVLAQFMEKQTEMNGILVNTQEQLMNGFLPSFQKLISDEMSSENCTHINTDNINTMISLNKNHINQSNTTVRTNSNSEIDRFDRYTAPTADMSVYKKYEPIIKDNIGYDDFVISKKPYELQEIDEIVEIMVQTVAFNTAPVSINGSLIPAEVVKSRFLKVTYGEIDYVLECLSHTTTKIYNIRKYLIAAIYNARTQNLYYGAEVRHDMYGSNSSYGNEG